MDDVLCQKDYDDFQKPQEINNDLIGICDSANGDFIFKYENMQEKDSYIGRINKGAQLKLINPIPQENDFQTKIIYVEILTNNEFKFIGKKGWIKLKSTTFRENYDSTEHRILTNTEIKSKFGNQIKENEDISNENFIGLVTTDIYGGAIYGNSDVYNRELRLGYLNQNDKIKLMETNVYKSDRNDFFDNSIIKVKVVSDNNYEGKIVWINLCSTSFKDYYNSKLGKIIINKGKNELEQAKINSEIKNNSIKNDTVLKNYNRKSIRKNKSSDCCNLI